MAIRHVIDLADLVLVMTVNPGFGGQAYIATMEPKIAEARALIDGVGPTGRAGGGRRDRPRHHRRSGGGGG